jgi:hypothetical protein
MRKLIRYERDYKLQWPKCIKDINHFIGIGAMRWDIMYHDEYHINKSYVKHKNRTYNVRNMVEQRAVLPFTFTLDLYTNFPEIILLFNGRGDDDYIRSQRIMYDGIEDHSHIEINNVCTLKRLTVRKFKKNWYNKYYDTEHI